MDHQEFLSQYRAGIVQMRTAVFGVRLQQALSMLPKRYQAAHALWSWVWFLSFPASIALGIWVKWWVGVVTFLFVPYVLRNSIQKSARGFLIEYAVESKTFYDWAISNQVIEVIPARK
jgi:hypothetical protein